jgi:crossover junction endodeoxyribonuclease RuvC
LNNESQVIFGVDPGTRVTGYGVILCERGKMVPIEFGCIRPPVKAKLSEKYHIIYTSLKSLIERHKPKNVVIETQFVHKNVQVAIKLGMARGAAIIAAKGAQASVYQYTPTKAKLAVTGLGNATKLQVQRMCQHLLHLKTIPEPEDAADALALAIAHAQSLKSPQFLGEEI